MKDLVKFIQSFQVVLYPQLFTDKLCLQPIVFKSKSHASGQVMVDSKIILTASFW